MKFINCSGQEIEFSEFVKIWSAEYGYTLESLYAERIHKKQFTNEDIQRLFEWKNGGPLSQKKQKSLENKIISKLDAINRLKSKFCLESFKNEFKNVSAIWKIYLLHVIAPEIYPIFDQHVCRSFYLLTENKQLEAPSTNLAKEELYWGEYVPFFNDLAKSGISRKKIDEALFRFGKFLKKRGDSEPSNKTCGD